MSRKIVAVVGLSGVGKSTSIDKLKSEIDFQHLQASSLIKAERERRMLESISTDVLRLANIDENQQLLITGFTYAVDINKKSLSSMGTQ